MFTAPDDLGSEEVGSFARRHWPLPPGPVEYAPVGFGSHHWRLGDWFLSADRLEGPADRARLVGAYGTAVALADVCDFVVAPTPDATGAAYRVLDDRYLITVRPFLDGERFPRGEAAGEDLQRARVQMLARLHAATPSVTSPVEVDHAALGSRAALLEALDDLDRRWPDRYGERTRAMLVEGRDALIGAVRHYDSLVERLLAQVPERVVTHGEPHFANVLVTDAGLRLIDWDTVRVAPPARDLWMIAESGFDQLPLYEELTGVSVPGWALGVYRRHWALSEIAQYGDRFRRPHPGSADDAIAFEELERYLTDPEASYWHAPL